jgi:hypothetical protein
VRSAARPPGPCLVKPPQIEVNRSDTPTSAPRGRRPAVRTVDLVTAPPHDDLSEKAVSLVCGIWARSSRELCSAGKRASVTAQSEALPRSRMREDDRRASSRLRHACTAWQSDSVDVELARRVGGRLHRHADVRVGDGAKIKRAPALSLSCESTRRRRRSSDARCWGRPHICVVAVVRLSFVGVNESRPAASVVGNRRLATSGR